jgi:predicted nuclease of predicted toxin-antitoxin system
MSYAFLIDANLSEGLSDVFKSAGYLAVHARELTHLGTHDVDLWRAAAASNWVVVTKDANLAHLGKHRKEAVHVVWLRIGNTRRNVLLDHVRRSLKAVVRALDEGEMLIEMR